MKIWNKKPSDLTVREYTLWTVIVWLVSFMVGFVITFFNVFEHIAEWFEEIRNKIFG